MTAPVDAPPIETPRLVLRGLAPEDAEGYVAFLTSPRAEHMGGPLDRPRAWIAFASELGHWRLRGFGGWAVSQKGSGACIGVIGGWFPDGWPEPEIDWMLWEGAEGRGYAEEATRAVRRFLYDSQGWSTCVSYIDPANTRSIRLAERLGAWADPDARTPYPGGLVFRHPPREAAA